MHEPLPLNKYYFFTKLDRFWLFINKAILGLDGFKLKSKLEIDQIIQYIRRGSRAAATSKMEQFVIIVNSWKPLTIITKRSVLDVAAGLDPPLILPMLPVSVTSSDLENAFSLRN